MLLRTIMHQRDLIANAPKHGALGFGAWRRGSRRDSHTMNLTASARQAAAQSAPTAIVKTLAASFSALLICIHIWVLTDPSTIVHGNRPPREPPAPLALVRASHT